MKRLLPVLLLALSACAAPGPGDAGPVTTLPPEDGPTTTTTSMESTTTTVGAPTTTSTTTGEGQTRDLEVYFLVSGLGERETRPGPFLVPVHRQVAETVAVARAALEELLAGPQDASSTGNIGKVDLLASQPEEPMLSTAIPENTILLGITVEDGLARVDLSREFESGGGTFSMTARLAQVVYTLTQFPTVDRVEFLLDGQPVEVFSSEGLVLEGPVTRDDYLDLLPLVFVDQPAWGGTLDNPARVVGRSNVFEATSQLALADAEGRILVEETVTATCGTGCWGDFDVTVPYRISEAQLGSVVVWTYSAEDGSPEDVLAYPVWLTP